ncbi:MAG TPA: hypothetical protein VLG50_04335 [Candidatus Saccharimonadales bacterium]|nr:hypothetical protein [Candidatus Saccharimonadales bacterium]
MYQIHKKLFLVTFLSLGLTNIINASKSTAPTADAATQKLIAIFQSDNVPALKKFITNNPSYKWAASRPGIFAPENTTPLIDAIVTTAPNCLTYLLNLQSTVGKNFTSSLKTKSGHSYFPLDYALNPTVKKNIVNILTQHYKDPKKYIVQKNAIKNYNNLLLQEKQQEQELENQGYGFL